MGEICNKDFSNAKIYCIRNNINNDIYVGSTCQSLSKRMQKHRSDCKRSSKYEFKFYQKMRELGVENFYIELMEKYPCSDVEELRAKEGEWIRQIATLNSRVAGRTPEQYRKDNEEHYKSYNKNRYEQNKEERSIQAKDRYDNNPDYQQRQKENSNNRYNEKKTEIRAKMNTKHLCECGKEYSYGNRLRHFNSQFHQNFLNNNINNVQKEKTNTISKT